jgi:hypothetical protein
MAVHGNATVWGSRNGIGRARSSIGWYQQLRDRWKAHKPASRERGLMSLAVYWDAEREVYKPLRAEAAIEIAIARGTLSMAMQHYSLIQ